MRAWEYRALDELDAGRGINNASGRLRITTSSANVVECPLPVESRADQRGQWAGLNNFFL